MNITWHRLPTGGGFLYSQSCILQRPKFLYETFNAQLFHLYSKQATFFKRNEDKQHSCF